jgi:exodeoxyribonuclease VII small subunit
MSDSKPESEDRLPFEQALAKLEEIVRQLEDGNLSLDESLSSYEQGIHHLRHCHVLLQAAERKIMLLTEIREDGTADLESFDEAQMTLEEKQESRGRRRSRGKVRSDAEPDVDTQKGLF